MKKTDVVCLCELYDLKSWFKPHFERDNPWINLVLPDEVAEPRKIEHAIAFSPGPEAFDPYPGLKLVSCAGAGVDALLGNPGLGSGTAVSRIVIPEQAQMIAAFALWFIVGWQRRMWEYFPLQKSGEWKPINRTPPSAFPVGILGHGSIGSSLAKTLTQLGYPVHAYGSRPRTQDGVEVVSGRRDLFALAAKVRALVNVLPLTPDTEGLLSAPLFSRMREDAILVQLGRGAHLVDGDLIEALDNGRPGMAALDVFASEPLVPDHPFWTHDKVMITPHVAGDADFRAIARFVADGIRAFDSGRDPAGLVDRNRGY